MAIRTSCIAVLVACLGVPSAFAQKTTPRFKVIAFYTGKADAAHISFVKEARPWFARMAAEWAITTWTMEPDPVRSCPPRSPTKCKTG